MPIYRHLKKEKSKRNICSLNSSSKHGWKKWRMKEGDSFPPVADKATWVWTPTQGLMELRKLGIEHRLWEASRKEIDEDSSASINRKSAIQ